MCTLHTKRHSEHLALHNTQCILQTAVYLVRTTLRWLVTGNGAIYNTCNNGWEREGEKGEGSISHTISEASSRLSIFSNEVVLKNILNPILDTRISSVLRHARTTPSFLIYWDFLRLFGFSRFFVDFFSRDFSGFLDFCLTTFDIFVNEFSGFKKNSGFYFIFFFF